MAEYDCHAFCKECGAHRRRMPFGSYNSFFDHGPCPKCGEWDSGGLIVRRERIGRWPWQRDWVTKEGLRAREAIRV